MADLRNLLGDICCFILLTPLTAVSTWLCISGAVHYSQSPFSGPGGWETIGLLSLSIFLVVVYSVWCLVSTYSTIQYRCHCLMSLRLILSHFVLSSYFYELFICIFCTILY